MMATFAFLVCALWTDVQGSTLVVRDQGILSDDISRVEDRFDPSTPHAQARQRTLGSPEGRKAKPPVEAGEMKVEPQVKAAQQRIFYDSMPSTDHAQKESREVHKESSTMKKDEKRVDDLQRLWGISVFPSFRLSGLIHENPSFQLYSPHIIRILVFVYFVQLFFPWMRLVGATKKDKTRTKQKEDQDEATDRQM